MTSRNAFVFDPDRCTSCEACRIACAIENNDGVDLGWRTVTTFNPSRHPALPVRHLSLACNHCEVPACANGCPANAYRVDATGAVLIEPEKCIGCRYCSWVCPYDAPKYDAHQSVMRKCTFCSHRLAESLQPACTTACPTGALGFAMGEGGRTSRSAASGAPAPDAECREAIQTAAGLGRPAAADLEVRPPFGRLSLEPHYHGLGPTGLRPSLRVLTPRSDAPPPPALAIDELLDLEPSQPVGPRKISARSEWTLLLFSIVMPMLTGWLGGSLLRYGRAPGALIFLGLGALVMTLSTAHLGRPLRAWRAVLNVRRSWLSREILFANLFLVLGTPFLMLPHADAILAAPAVIAGVALCISIDGVYRAIPRIDGRKTHSAEALLTAVLWFGITASSPFFTWAAATLKAILFTHRWITGRLGLPQPLAALRLIFLAAACVADVPWSIGFGCILAGELLDRASFYEELEPATPARRMAKEMEERMEAQRA